MAFEDRPTGRSPPVPPVPTACVLAAGGPWVRVHSPESPRQTGSPRSETAAGPDEATPFGKGDEDVPVLSDGGGALPCGGALPRITLEGVRTSNLPPVERPREANTGGTGGRLCCIAPNSRRRLRTRRRREAPILGLSLTTLGRRLRRRAVASPSPFPCPPVLEALEPIRTRVGGGAGLHRSPPGRRGAAGGRVPSVGRSEPFPRIVGNRRNPYSAFAINTGFPLITPEANKRRFRLYS
jgi:hypothetical protein